MAMRTLSTSMPRDLAYASPEFIAFSVLVRYWIATDPAATSASITGRSDHETPVMLPVVQARTCCDEFGSATSMKNCCSALNTYISDVPARITMAGEGFLNLDSARMTAAGTRPNTKALTTTPRSPGTMHMPRVMAMVAPNAAADDIPVVYGSARGFFSMLCMAAPATPRPAPTTTAEMMRGRRWSQTTDLLMLSTRPRQSPVTFSHRPSARAAYTSRNPMG